MRNPMAAFTKTAYTALDFGHYGVKMVHCRAKNGTIILKKASWAEVEPGVMDQGEVRDPSRMARSLEALLDLGGIKPAHLIFAPSSLQIVVRTLEMPVMEDEELREALRWEAEEFLPFSGDELVFDYIILDREGESRRVLLVVMAEVILDQYLEALALSNLKPRVANASELALVSLLIYQGLLEETSLIVDIGIREAQIVIADRENLYLSRSAEIGEEDLSRALVRRSRDDGGVPPTGDEGVQEGAIPADPEQPDGTEGQAEDHQNLELLAVELAQEIIRSIAYFQERQPGSDVERVYITGGASNFPEFRDVLTTHMESEVEVLDPLVGIEVRNTEEMGDPGMYTIALGLVASEVLHDAG